jgi:hypothetical protein
MLFIVGAIIGCDRRGPQEVAMPKPKQVSAEILRLHHIVEHGSLEETGRALHDGGNINAPGHVGQTALMVAIGVQDLEKMKLLLDRGADPELTDDFNATALRRAVACDFQDGVRFLLSLDVDRGYAPKYPLKKVNYDFGGSDVVFPEELKGVISAQEWQQSLAETTESMKQLGQKPVSSPMISEVQSVNVLQLFLDAGDDVNLAPNDVKRAYVGLSDGGTFQASFEDYAQHNSPGFGTANPARMDNPFWNDMIRLGCSAYFARQHFSPADPLSKPGAVWCFDRFGSSLTRLADGRFVQIAGEHEDHYDPDFYIYNDVVIHDGEGSFQIFGYPKEVFPPTDFHTATLVGDCIYIIGCLGYPEQREDTRTPVYRLKLETWEIESVPASGETPRWLHRHRARLQPTQDVIRVEAGDVLTMGADGNPEITPNDDQFELDLSSFQWRKL